MENFRVVKAGKKSLKRDYIALLLWFMGKAIQAASAVDEAVKREFETLPDYFTFSLGVMPGGPYMIVRKTKKGIVQYIGWDPTDQKIDLTMNIKNIEAAWLLFTFQESTAVSTARNRLIVDGEIPHACAVVRILDIVEVYLLPKLIARLAVKRYPVWPPSRKYLGRIWIYIRTILGF